MVADFEVSSVDVSVFVRDLVTKFRGSGSGFVIHEDSYCLVELDKPELGEGVPEAESHLQALM